MLTPSTLQRDRRIPLELPWREPSLEIKQVGKLDDQGAVQRAAADREKVGHGPIVRVEAGRIEAAVIDHEEAGVGCPEK